MSKQSKILVISDLHVGSIYALWHPDSEIKGTRWNLNVLQNALWKAWNEMLETINKKRFDAIVVNGDVIDGIQQKSRGIPCITTDISEQAEGAICLLKDLRKLTDHMFLIRGTEYHDSICGEAINEIGRALNCDPFKKGQYSSAVLNLEINGSIINFSHYISVMTGLYRATALDREGVWASISGKTKTPDAKCVVRSHLHYFIHVEHSSRHIVVTPCWQLHTEYEIRKGYYRFFPEIGIVIISVDNTEQDPISIKKLLWKTPPEPVFKV